MTVAVLFWVSSLGIYGNTPADFCNQLPASRYYALRASGKVPGLIYCEGDGILYSFTVVAK